MHGHCGVLLWVSFMWMLSVSGCVLDVVISVCTGCCGHLINIVGIVSCVGKFMFAYIVCLCDW